MQSLLIVVDGISTWSGKIVAWCIVILAGTAGYEVFSRYVLGRPTAWAFDVSYLLYGALFILAGAYALSRDAHVRGDFLYRTWPPRAQAAMDLVLYVLFFFPGILALIYSGYVFARPSGLIDEHSFLGPAGSPIHHFKSLIAIAGVLLLLQGIAEVIRCIGCLKTGAWPHRPRDVEDLAKVVLDERQARDEPSR